MFRRILPLKKPIEKAANAMAGAYGEINSKVDYDRVLRKSTDIVRRILGRTPNNLIMHHILKELDAMRRWTQDGREPSHRERSSIDVGLIAARELSERVKGQILPTSYSV
jgi:hypothetical protein